MSHKAKKDCKHPWHHMGPENCPGCKDTIEFKARAGMPAQDLEKRGWNSIEDVKNGKPWLKKDEVE